MEGERERARREGEKKRETNDAEVSFHYTAPDSAELASWLFFACSLDRLLCALLRVPPPLSLSLFLAAAWPIEP